MSIVGGLDIHRKQITFDVLDSDTGEVRHGQIAPADREHLAGWLAAGYAGRTDVGLALEGCTGWWYVADEIRAAGLTAQVGEPADVAAARGRKRHAKTDKADARHLRQLLTEGRIPRCWIPPAHIIEGRQRLETYNDLRVEHTAWVQRTHAVFFHHGAPALISDVLATPAGRAAVLAQARAHLPPAALEHVEVCLAQLAALEDDLARVHRQLVTTARHLTGARVLTERLYGVGPITGLALTCWLGGAGRFSSSRQAVRFAGLDITVYSSDGKRRPGRLSRQGPPVLRWCVYEAGKVHSRGSAPDHAYYASVKERSNGKRAALSEARKILRQAMHILTELGEDALRVT